MKSTTSYKGYNFVKSPTSLPRQQFSREHGKELYADESVDSLVLRQIKDGGDDAVGVQMIGAILLRVPEHHAQHVSRLTRLLRTIQRRGSGGRALESAQRVEIVDTFRTWLHESLSQRMSERCARRSEWPSTQRIDFKDILPNVECGHAH